MKKILVFFSTLMVVLITVNCTDHKDTKNTLPPIHKNDLSSKLMILNDSVNLKWKQMMAADSQKFADIKRLLEEISYCKKYNEKEFENLMTLRNKVYAERYTQEGLTDSKIDKYDSLTTLLIKKVRNLKVSTPEILQHPLADQLENEILKADNEDVILFRKRYDSIVEKYNSFLDQNKEVIAKDPNLESFKKRKLFAVAS
jgi:hypothetical protein